MSFLKKKNLWHRLLHSPVTLGVLLVLSVGLVFSVYDRYVIEREMSDRLKEKQSEIEELKERRDALEKKVEYLSDDRGVEAEIRQHFDVAREGEQVIVLVEGDHKSTSSSNTVRQTEPPSFWSRFIPW